MKRLSKTAARTLIDLINARGEAKELTEHAKALQPDVVQAIESMGQKSASIEHDGFLYTGTVVRGSSMRLDPDKLKTRIGAKLWNRVTTRTLDSAKLEAAVANGLISEHDVAICSEEVEREPFIKGTIKPMRKE